MNRIYADYIPKGKSTKDFEKKKKMTTARHPRYDYIPPDMDRTTLDRLAKEEDRKKETQYDGDTAFTEDQVCPYCTKIYPTVKEREEHQEKCELKPKPKKKSTKSSKKKK